MAQTLVNLAIVKGKDQKGVLIFGFDVAVTVEEQSGQSDKVSAGVGLPLLSVICFKAGIDGQSAQSQTSTNSHRIKFSVPISFNASN